MAAMMATRLVLAALEPTPRPSKPKSNDVNYDVNFVNAVSYAEEPSDEPAPEPIPPCARSQYTWYGVWYSPRCGGWYYTDWAGNRYVDGNMYVAWSGTLPQVVPPMRLSKLRLHTDVFPENLAKFQNVEGLTIDEIKLPRKKKKVKVVKVIFADAIEYF